MISNSTNQGVAKSRNIGFQKATGEYLSFLDADDMLCGKFSLEHRVNFLMKQKQFQGIGGYSIKIDESNALLELNSNKTIQLFREGCNYPDKLQQIYCKNILTNSNESASALFLMTGSCMFRRNELTKYPFDPSFETEDDIEWLLRFLGNHKIKLEMLPFHFRRVHSSQYHLVTPKNTTRKIFEICQNLLK